MYFTTQDLLELKPSNSCENQLGWAKIFLDATKVIHTKYSKQFK